MVTAYVPIKNRLDSLLSLASGRSRSRPGGNHHDFFSGRGPVPKFPLLVQKEGINRGFLSGPLPWLVILTPERFVFTITSRRLASAPQEIDSISPVPIPSFSCQSGQGPDQTADIRGRNGFFVHKNHAAVRSLFFRPGFEQGRNRPPVISNKR
jgi:hypothetical protein